MMLREVLTLGDKIEIRPLDKIGNPIHNTRSFTSKLMDFSEVDVLNIAVPIVCGRAIPLNPGGLFNLCFYTKNGLYQCNCEVINNIRENNLIITVVRITTNLEKYQRRQYYRLECILNINYRIISEEEVLLEHELQTGEIKDEKELNESKNKLLQFNTNWHRATVIDISGGGLRFNSPVMYNRGDKLYIILDLTLNKTVKKLMLRAKIISSTNLKNREDAFENRVEFIGIAPKDRDELIGYIFDQERKRRKK